MSRVTVFLARLVGLLALLLVGAMLVRGTAIVEALVADGPAMFALGIVSLAAGLAMVLGHNVWSGGVLPVVVTLAGWLIFAKALLLLLLAPDAVTPILDRMQYGEHPMLYLIPASVFGLYLTWAGFTAPFKSGT